MALQVEKPWELREIKFDEQEQAWHLFMDFERGAEFVCPLCGGTCKAYDAENKEWRHLDFWEWKTYMHVNQAMEQVDLTEVKRTKYIWLKNESNLKVEQKETLERLKDSNLQTGRAYRLRLALQDLWSVRHVFADMYLKEWLGWATRSQLAPMIRVAQTIK